MLLRRLVAADAERLFELDADPEVRRYVHAGPPNLERIRREILPRMCAAYGAGDDLGFWAAEEKTSGAFAGWFCLRPEPEACVACDRDVLEIGFRLRRPVWGQGLATEGATLLVAVAFAAAATSRVVALTLMDNTLSRRVLEKVGFEVAEELLYEPPPHSVVEHPEANRRAYRYVLTRERFQVTCQSSP